MRDGETILLVEDDEVDVLTVRRALRDLGVATPLRVAAHGEEALDLLRGSEPPRPALVLLDLDMPRMNGLEFLRAVRAEGLLHGVPVVVLTTSRRERDIAASFDLAVAGYMVKPAEFHRFVDMIRIIDHYWTLSELPSRRE